METVLSERNKTLAGYLTLFIILLLPFLFTLRTGTIPEPDHIGRSILKRIGDIEQTIGEEIDELKYRSDLLYKRFRVSVLRHEEMLPGESLVIIKDGVIDSYFGEVFYYRSPDIKPGEWTLIKKEDFIYFIESFDDNVYFIKKYRKSVSLFQELKDEFPFISAETKFYNDPSPELESRVQYDDNVDVYFIYHVSESTNKQLYLIIKFSTGDYYLNWKKMSEKKFLAIYLFLVLAYMLLLPGRLKLLRTVSRIIFITALFMLIRLLENHSLNIAIPGVKIRSVLMFLYFSVLIYIFLIWISKKIKNERLLLFLIFLSMIVSVSLSVILIRSVNFVYMNFKMDIDYLLFVLTLFLLLRIPFRIMDLNTSPGRRRQILYFILLCIVFVPAVSYLAQIPYMVPVIIAVFLALNFLIKNSFFVEIVKIFALSVVLFLLVFTFSESEKEMFTSVGLKNIFSNQNNYAKFISRELIHNIHQRNENLSEYFKTNSKAELEMIWRRSIALKENISSGIYVISPGKKILSSFSYRIPYLNVTTDNMFPFWMIDEFKAEYFGRTISVAVASINIFEGQQYLGKIIIQVINSSDLITKDHPDSNIFTLDNRINGDDISYIKLNSKMQIIENPSNIDIKNLKRRTSDEKNWIGFEFMDTWFNGYMFDNNEDTLIVFFPRITLSEVSANIIKIFLLLILISGVFNFRSFLDSKWQTFLRTFSFKVFAILILISLFSAITFSIFSIQFNKRNREIEFRRQIYNNGGVAYNIISDIIQQNNTLERDDLFYLSKILNSDITIYRKDNLMDTSNYNKIIKSEIPILINSGIPALLEESEKFFIEKDGDSSRIFFNVADYIVRLDFSGVDRDILTRTELFSNFIINLFFILTVTGILLAFLFRRKILSPINILNNKMSKVEIGELEKISEIPGEIELKNLFNGFNSMVNGIHEQKKSVSDIARMRTLIKLSRWIAHEVKNPLTPIKLSAEQILRSLEDKRENYEDLISESIRYIIDETDHLRNISLGFLDISNLDKINVSRFNIKALCENEIFKLKQIYNNIEFKIKSADDIPEVSLDKIKITQVLKNLLTNSVESIKSREGEILLSIGPEAGGVGILLKDNGTGIDGTVFEKLFDEDFSTKSSGTGLGLFIVKRIIDLHKGSITFDSSSSGTTVQIILPVSAEEGEAEDG